MPVPLSAGEHRNHEQVSPRFGHSVYNHGAPSREEDGDCGERGIH